MITIEVFRIDAWDGGERHNFDCYIKQEGNSLPSLKEKRKHDVIFPQLVTVFDTLEERMANSIIETRRRAWDKLTAHERVALGMATRP